MEKKVIVRNERGAVLITGLILLLVLTFLGIVAMQGTTMQERMAGNLEQQALAFEAAEAGLRDAETWLENTALLPALFNNTNGLYQPAEPGNDPRWVEVDWNASSSVNYRTYQGDDLDDAPYPAPRYIIELVATVEGDDSDSQVFGPSEGEGARVYRITSRGVGPNGRSIVMLQSTYLR